ncbi:MAG: YnfA family protein [Rhizobiaceae bacterium]|nr:YnfA family protein [Rhizobiaceae bacterium]
MPAIATTYLTFAAAAVAEIAGCFAFWAWLRNGQSVWWLVPGIAALVLFAWLLTLTPSAFAGRAYAAYGGIYIAASLLWLWLAEEQRPDFWDMTGGALAIAAAGLILFAPRAG